MFAAFLTRLSRSRRPVKRRPHPRPRLTRLEDRNLPSTFTVTNLHDDGPNSLRAEIAAANASPGPDTIAFAHGLSGTIRLTSGELSITDSVTITGPGPSRLAVSGNDASRVFEIAVGQDVTISGLTITHGFAQDQGGGILNDGSNLTLTGDVLSQNVAFGSDDNARGGGLRSLDGTLTITGCTIAGNQALGSATAFGNGVGGGVYVLAGTARISASTFSNNLARGADNAPSGNGGVTENGSGGALDAVAPATIIGCTFTGNQAVGGNGGTGGFVGDAFGGAINVISSVTISGSTFDNNRAIGGSDGDGDSGPGTDDPFPNYAFGGAICGQFFTNLTVTGSTFSHNLAVGGNDSTVAGPDIVGVGGAEGGAINSEVGATASFTGCSFIGNQAIGGHGNSGSGSVVLVGEGLGGAIVSGYSGSELGPNPLTVGTSTFINNTAVGGDNNSGTATVSGLVGVGAGAGIANYAGGTADISSSVLVSNQAIGGQGNTAGGTGAILAGLGTGGAIFNYLGNYTSPDVDFGQLDTSVVAVNGCVIAFNRAQGGSGSNGAGGGIADMQSATTTVASSSLVLNQAIGGADGVGLGGGLFNDATSSLTLTTSLVALNRAEGATGIGGGVYNLGAFSHDALTIIIFNHASTSGDDIGP